nr:hypothetical protein [Tanacetum cinerariifolium]
MASAVICLATSRKFNFSKYIFDSMVRNMDITSKFLMYLRFLQVILDNQVDDISPHNTKYTSPALTQKVFTNMRRVGKGGCIQTGGKIEAINVDDEITLADVETHKELKEEEEVEMPITPLPPSLTSDPLPPLQDPTPTPHAIPPDSPPQEQPTSPHDSTMPLLTTLMETCASLSQKVVELEQDKHTQALEILKLKKRVKKLEKKKRSKYLGFKRLRRVGTSQRVESSTDIVLEEIKVFWFKEVKEGGCIQTWGKIEAINVDDEITLVDVETHKETFKTLCFLNYALMIRHDYDLTSSLRRGALHILTIAILLGEVGCSCGGESGGIAWGVGVGSCRGGKGSLVKDGEENIDWNAVAKQIQERHLYNIRKYQSLKKKPVSIAQAMKNMIIYLKNMAEYKMEHFRGMTYNKVRPIFEREYKKVQTLFKLDKDVEEPKKKRVADETLLQESFKKLRATEVSGSESTLEIPSNDPKEMSKEDVQNMLEIIPVCKFKVEALQVKYPIIDWEIHTEGSRTYWKIIRVGGITEVYQSFEDMLKGFDREDLVALWNLVKEKFNSAVPNEDKEKALLVELKRLFEPDADDVLWKLQIYMHAPLT